MFSLTASNWLVYLLRFISWKCRPTNYKSTLSYTSSLKEIVMIVRDLQPGKPEMTKLKTLSLELTANIFLKYFFWNIFVLSLGTPESHLLQFPSFVYSTEMKIDLLNVLSVLKTSRYTVNICMIFICNI